MVNDQWETGDQVYFAMVYQKNGYYDYLDTTRLTVSNGNLTFNTPFYYPDTTVSFIGFYPYNTDIFYGRDSARLYINTDQSNNLTQEYLLSNNVKNQAPTHSLVQMTFNYVLPEISIHLGDSTFQENLSNTTAKITGTGIGTGALMCLRDGKVDNYGWYRDSIYTHKVSTNTYGANFEALILPTTFFASTSYPVKFVFETGSRTIEYNVPMGTVYESGKHYHI